MIQRFIWLSLVLGLLPCYLGAQIQFAKGTWQEAMAQAQKENKLLFVDAYATWCGPCKMMDRDVFSNKAVGDYFNKNFISYKLDMETPNGREFNAKYPVNAYPSFFFLDGSGAVTHTVRGYMAPDPFMEEGKKAQAKKKPGGSSTKPNTTPPSKPNTPPAAAPAKQTKTQQANQQKFVNYMSSVFCDCLEKELTFADKDVFQALSELIKLNDHDKEEAYIAKMSPNLQERFADQVGRMAMSMEGEGFANCANQKDGGQDLENLDMGDVEDDVLMKSVITKMKGTKNCNRATVFFEYIVTHMGM